MVWGAIIKIFCSQLVILHGNLTAWWYIDNDLQPVLATLIKQHRQDNRLVFQQDNARAHTLRLTWNFLQKWHQGP